LSEPDAPLPADDDVLTDDIELAYRRALAANDAVELEMGEIATEPPPERPAHAPLPDTADPVPEAAAARNVTPSEVIEAALFVGGPPLTIRKLATLFQTEFDNDRLEQTIDELNQRYLSENRPYEIHLEEGGYRLALREQFERVRNRVFGLGPKDVKLSQDALEVLALVAYRQPISREIIEEAGKHKPSAVLRQLLRRELIAIQRSDETGDDVEYVTTPRFLSVFDITALADLPTADDLTYK
jgi:segregation and condensation protein B